MWRTIRKSLALATVFAGLFAVPVRAENLVANVPFPFVVNGKTMPAGQYRLQPGDEGRDVILIQGNKSANSKASAFALTTPSGGHDPGGDKPTLVFSRHENQYVLSTIWDSKDEGHSVPKS